MTNKLTIPLKEKMSNLLSSSPKVSSSGEKYRSSYAINLNSESKVVGSPVSNISLFSSQTSQSYKSNNEINLTITKTIFISPLKDGRVISRTELFKNKTKEVSLNEIFAPQKTEFFAYKHKLLNTKNFSSFIDVLDLKNKIDGSNNIKPRSFHSFPDMGYFSGMNSNKSFSSGSGSPTFETRIIEDELRITESHDEPKSYLSTANIHIQKFTQNSKRLTLQKCYRSHKSNSNSIYRSDNVPSQKSIYSK